MCDLYAFLFIRVNFYCFLLGYSMMLPPKENVIVGDNLNSLWFCPLALTFFALLLFFVVYYFALPIVSFH